MIEETFTDNEGKFEFKVYTDENYILIGEKENYFSIEDKISILRENTNEILNSLSAREERLIRMYYGYGLNYPMEVYEIAKQFDLSEVDIRQQLSTVFRKFLKRYFFLLKPK